MQALHIKTETNKITIGSGLEYELRDILIKYISRHVKTLRLIVCRSVS